MDLPSNQLILVLQLGQNLKVDVTILELQVFYFSSEEQSTFTSRMPMMRRSEQFILDLTSNHPSWFLCECKMVFFYCIGKIVSSIIMDEAALMRKVSKQV